MTNLTFDHLAAIYRNTAFRSDGEGSLLTIADQGILDNLRLIEASEVAAADANIAVLCDPRTLSVGKQIDVEIGPPRGGLGVLARDVDHLLRGPRARVAEPRRYFIVEYNYEKQDLSAPAAIVSYRALCRLIALLAEAAAFLDPDRQELVFVGDKKLVVPVRYDAQMLGSLDRASLDALLESFSDTMHREQKLEILATVVRELTQNARSDERFPTILRYLDALKQKVDDGYRLFASSFSFEKIRSELEEARVDYFSKIHKTLTDVQGQALALPLAAIIVATQLEEVPACSKEFWGNSAVLVGAWVFGILLLIAVGNQFYTLHAIRSDVNHQRDQMRADHEEIVTRFNKVFNAIGWRMFWHALVLGVIGIIAFAGAAFATVAYLALTDVSALTCVTSMLDETRT